MILIRLLTKLLYVLVSDDLPFEFKALELVLELSCLSLDAQVCHTVFSNVLVLGFIILLYDLLHDSSCNYKMSFKLLLSSKVLVNVILKGE